MVTDDVVAIPHPTPLASCHIVVFPRRHVPNFYDLDVAEQRQIWHIIGQLCKRIQSSLQVEGSDVGFADGEHDDPASHAYVHLIPRIAGDRVEFPMNAQWVNLDS